jgi:hypothetical protein
MLFEAYVGEAMKKSLVFEWCKRFKESQENVEGNKRSCSRSHRTDENVEGAAIFR